MADILCEHGRVVDCEDVDCLLAYADASKSFRIAWKIVEKLTAEIKEADDRIFKIKQIGDRLFMLSNRLNPPARTEELDEAIGAWADVHKGEV